MERYNILFVAFGNESWIGGLYYVKNILYSILNSKDASLINVYILVDNKNSYIFDEFTNISNVKIIINENKNKKVLNLVSNLVFRSFNSDISRICKRYKIDYIYPVNKFPYLGLKNKCIFWIPDFQHIYFPNLFSKFNYYYRNILYYYISLGNNKLILSSNSASEDFKKNFLTKISRVRTYIVPFISHIEKEVNELDEHYVKDVTEKYKLPDKFIFLPNQLWKHKNHITAFKAINYLKNRLGKDFKLICTGNTKDHRNSKNYTMLLKYINDNKLENNIKILGFIPRKDQLAIMRLSMFIIQPSLFEGWGTVVEDAKILDKHMLISNIKVHEEQSSKKCIIFDKDNYKDLANKIEEIDTMIARASADSIENGISDARTRSEIYSKEFYRCLFEE